MWLYSVWSRSNSTRVDRVQVEAEQRHAVPPLVLGRDDEIVAVAAGMIVVAAADPVADESAPVVRSRPDVLPPVKLLAVRAVVENRGAVRLGMIVALRADEVGVDEGEPGAVKGSIRTVGGRNLLDIARINLAEQRINVLDRLVLRDAVGAAVELGGIVAADTRVDVHARGPPPGHAGHFPEQIPGGRGLGIIVRGGIEHVGRSTDVLS